MGTWGRLLSTLLTTLIYLLKTLSLWPSFFFPFLFPLLSIYDAAISNLAKVTKVKGKVKTEA